MSMEGQGESQPTEGVHTLSDLVGMQDDGDTQAEPEQEDGEGEAEEVEELESGESDEGEQEAGEEGQDDDPTVTIKHDGKEVSVKLSEALNLAQQGFDYSKKTMALADDRKAVEAIKSQAEGLRQQHEQALNQQIQQLQALQEFIQSELGAPPDVSLASEDAAEYIFRKELHDRRAGTLQQAMHRAQQLSQEAQRQRQAWIEVQADETYKALQDTLPGWNDEMLDGLAQYANGLGLNPKNADLAFVQKGFWELAYKAKAYDALQAEKAKIKPVAKPPKVVKPGAANQSNLETRQEAWRKHKNEPSIGSLAALMD